MDYPACLLIALGLLYAGSTPGRLGIIMSRQKFVFPEEDVRLEVVFNRETITVEGYENVVCLSENEEDGEYLTHLEHYSGYTLSECLCKALIDMDRASDWPEAIEMLGSIGIEYVSDED